MKVRNAYSTRERSYVPATDHPSTQVKQEFKKEVNINSIVAKMKKGQMPPEWMTSNTPRYGDFSNMPTSFMEAYDIVSRAEEAFASLPLGFRRELDHDPRNLEGAPFELFERFGLAKEKPEAGKAQGGAFSGSGTPEGQGDRDLPVKAPPGAKKGTSKQSEGANSEA